MTVGIFAILIVLGITYIWVMRGFFSALVHLVCTIAAGAIAFGLWEPLGYWLLSASPERGTLAFMRDISWSIALAVPFAASLALLRAATNKLLPANCACEPAVDYAGGGLCGLASGVITAGFFLLALGFMRFSPDGFGYQPVSFTTQAAGRGSIERSRPTLGIMHGMTPRFDMITARFYERLSLTSLRTGEPLGKWYPRMDDVPAANRLTYNGKGRNTLRPADFRVLGWYTIGLEPRDTAYRGGPMDPLLRDQWNEAGQQAVDLDGNPINNGYVAGFKVQLNSGAKERQGQIIVGNGQVRLVCESVSDESFKTLHPVAVVTQAGIESLQPGQIPISARFRYDGNEVFFASVGGASDATMWFEFAVPTGYKPLGLYIKNVRWEVQGGPTVYTSPAARDQAIVALGGSAGAPPTENPQEVVGEGIVVSNSLGWSIQRGSHKGLSIAREGRNTSIVEGDEKFTVNELRAARGNAPIELLIDRFQADPNVCVVKVDVSMGSKASILSRVAAEADPNQPPVLVDTNGQRYEAVGFIYSDDEKVHIRYSLGRPIKGLAELVQQRVTLSRSRVGQRLELIYRPTFGVSIKEFRIGSAVIADWSEDPIECMNQQR